MAQVFAEPMSNPGVERPVDFRTSAGEASVAVRNVSDPVYNGPHKYFGTSARRSAHLRASPIRAPPRCVPGQALDAPATTPFWRPASAGASLWRPAPAGTPRGVVIRGAAFLAAFALGEGSGGTWLEEATAAATATALAGNAFFSRSAV